MKRLHSVLREAGNDIDRLGAGCFLICIYSRARWSDVRYVDHFEIEEGRFVSLTLFTVEHKTASVGLRREQFLPLIVPWEGIVNEDWIKIFLEVYQRCGLDLAKRPLGPLLPAPKATGQFCARPLSTSEAAAWLRALLEGATGFDTLRSHLLKSTLLIWSAKAGSIRKHERFLDIMQVRSKGLTWCIQGICKSGLCGSFLCCCVECVWGWPLKMTR